MLPLHEVVPLEDKLKVTFDVPQQMQSKLNDEVLFLCFSGDYDEEDRHSERILYSVQWRSHRR